jgi:phosphotransacetylase
VDQGEAPRFRHLEEFIARARQKGAIRMAAVHPVDLPSLQSVAEAAAQGLIVPVLVGPKAKIERCAREAAIDIAGFEIVTAPHSHAAGETAVQLVREGRSEAIVKGALHTDEVMAPVVDKQHGLRTARRVSHVFAIELPKTNQLVFITDAAINIAPDVEQLRDIVQNAIDLAHALDLPCPKVAILSAVETVRSDLPSTLNAAALCKMADRGQITGGLLDGPLAFDLAVSEEAVALKGLTSPVAGKADILVVPDLVSGNMLAKQLDYLAGAEAAGIVLGARVPIALTSRADSPAERVASMALAVLYHHWRKTLVPMA